MTPSEAITSLQAYGMTEAAIGAAVGARQSTINKIKRGDMTPNWETGKALVDLALALPANSPGKPRPPEVGVGRTYTADEVAALAAPFLAANASAGCIGPRQTPLTVSEIRAYRAAFSSLPEGFPSVRDADLPEVLLPLAGE